MFRCIAVGEMSVQNSVAKKSRKNKASIALRQRSYVAYHRKTSFKRRMCRGIADEGSPAAPLPLRLEPNMKPQSASQFIESRLAAALSTLCPQHRCSPSEGFSIFLKTVGHCYILPPLVRTRTINAIGGSYVLCNDFTVLIAPEAACKPAFVWTM